MQEKKERKVGRPSREQEWDGSPEDMPLNQTEKLFVHHYCDTGSITEAARKTGSDAKDLSKAGSKILHRPNVKKAIKLHQDEYIKNSAVTKSSLTVMLMKNWEAAVEKGDIKAANDAVKLLGQTCPDFFYTPVKNVDLNSESKPKDITNTGNVVDAKAQEVFSITNLDEDIDMDLERHLTMDKSREMGLDEFDSFDKDGNVISNDS